MSCTDSYVWLSINMCRVSCVQLLQLNAFALFSKDNGFFFLFFHRVFKMEEIQTSHLMGRLFGLAHSSLICNKTDEKRGPITVESGQGMIGHEGFQRKWRGARIGDEGLESYH